MASSPERSRTCTGLTYTMQNLGTRRLMSFAASSTSYAHRACRPPLSGAGGVDCEPQSAPSSGMADDQAPIGDMCRRFTSAAACLIALYSGRWAGWACPPHRLHHAGDVAGPPGVGGAGAA